MSYSRLPVLRAGLAGLALAALLLQVAAAQTVPENRALLTVKAPAKAAITIDGYQAKQSGAERLFVTPPLAPGKDYVYTVTAAWDGNSVSKKVFLRAGQSVQVDLTDGAEAKAEPPAKKEKEPVIKDEPPAKKEKEPDIKEEAKSRTFLFTYGVTVTDVPAGKKARIWLPVPPEMEHQDVKIESTKELPKGFKIGEDKKSGNKFLYVEAEPGKDGTIPLAITYLITRREVTGPTLKESATADQLARFLEPDALVPVAGKPVEEIKGKVGLTEKKLPKDELAAAKVLYDTVNSHMKYDKPKGKAWGRGDSVWACDNGVGNCTDFHSLFISLARANNIPAKFEIGFSIPPEKSGEIAGYHCWAKFKPKGKGWLPVDISEANRHPDMRDYYFGNLTVDRVTFSTGRDIELIPKQAGKPLNFFVYPYVEVDGEPLAAEKIKRKITYKDVSPASKDADPVP